MSKPLIWALLLMALCALFFIFTDGSTTIDFFKMSWKMETSIILLIFTSIGIIIGALLK